MSFPRKLRIQTEHAPLVPSPLAGEGQDEG